jgi:hypothetical protein|tara:strand:- start:379 stop:867 length:489 start_codon:yes stop_codon:yes gene_type:complete
MWTVIKFDQKKLNLMKKDISEKVQGVTRYYIPKILIQYYNKNKLINKEINLLGDYIFCFNQDLENKNRRESIKFSRGLKYLLNGQGNDIKKFIEICKNFEDKNGYVNLSFLNIIKNNNYKFTSGPFVNEIFKVINFQKNKIDILIGKFKTSFNKKEFLFIPA